MKIIKFKEVDILDFEKENKLELIVFESPYLTYSSDKYKAYFENVTIKESVTKGKLYGSGSTPERAISDYCRNISGETLITADLKVIEVEKLIYSKLNESYKNICICGKSNFKNAKFCTECGNKLNE